MKSNRIITVILALLLTGFAAPVLHAQSAPATPAVASATPVFKAAEKIKSGYVPNLGQMAPNLFRGGQPEGDGYAELHKLGVGIVVNFRETEKADKNERAAVEKLGMKYVDIPWSGFDNPDNKNVAKFLQVLKENPEQKVFFHCRRGAERTGVMGAVYRMVHQGWTPEQALQEMEQFKFRGFWFRHLKRYVRSFPEQLKTDPALQPFLPVTTAGK